VELKYEAEPREPHLGPFVLRHGGGRAAVDQNVAVGRQVEQSEQVQQRRLSGSGWACDGK
jgi:hypothetical protein